MRGNPYTPIPSFYFGVSIGNVDDIDSHFQEVSGLEAEIEMEEVIEGGNNSFKYRLPVRTSYRNLVLKRGIILRESRLYSWIESVLFQESNLDNPIEFNALDVNLLNGKDKDVVKNWRFEKAFPVKWSLSNFNAQENGLAIESIEFSFQSFKED